MTMGWQVAIAGIGILAMLEAAAIVALARSVGSLQLRLGAPPLDTHEGLELGTATPPLVVNSRDHERPLVIEPNTGRWLIVFVSATCYVCHGLVRDIAVLMRSRPLGVRVVAVSRGSSEQNDVFRRVAPKLPIFDDPQGLAMHTFRVDSTPFVYVVDEGAVKARAVVNNTEQIEDLLEGKVTHRPGDMWTTVGSVSESSHQTRSSAAIASGGGRTDV